MNRFIQCRMFNKSAGDYYPLGNVICPDHIVQANDAPVITQDEDGANERVFYLIACRFSSGEVTWVESTPELRASLNLPSFLPDLGTLRLRKVAGNANLS